MNAAREVGKQLVLLGMMAGNVMGGYVLLGSNDAQGKVLGQIFHNLGDIIAEGRLSNETVMEISQKFAAFSRATLMELEQ